MKQFYFTRLFRGVMLILLTLSAYAGGTASAEDYSIYNSDNKQVLAVYINEDVYILDNQYYPADNYDGAVTPEIQVEVRGYISRQPGVSPDEGKIVRLKYDDYSVGSRLTGKSDLSTEPSWFPMLQEVGSKNVINLNNNSRPYQDGIAYTLYLYDPYAWLNGTWNAGQYLYGNPDPKEPKNYTRLADDIWQVHVGGRIQFFKYGDLVATTCCTGGTKLAPFPLDISPDTSMLRMANVFIDSFGIKNTLLKGGPAEGFSTVPMYVIGNIHFAHSSKSVAITGNQLSASKNEITVRDSDPIGSTIGKPVSSTLSFPFTSTDPITSLRLSNAANSRRINGLRVFDTGVEGIGYQLTDNNGKELSPDSAVVQGGNLTVPVNLTFIKTGEIMSGSNVSKLTNMGKLMVITGKVLKDRVLYDPDQPLTYDGNAKIIVPPLGCE
ncbi:hypothetical protein PUG81_23395 [Erwiniaceae bacterium L1_54_6]|nr:hypothetical protein [Erwiniaceae bacterium L1_54_6]